MRLSWEIRRTLFGALACLLAVACAPIEANRPALAPPAQAEAIWRSTVLVETGQGHGSGVIIGDRTVLTALHVVDDGAVPMIEFLGGERAIGVVGWSSALLDLAVVDVRVPGDYPEAALFCGRVGQAQHLVAIGHPLTTRWVSVEGQLGTEDPAGLRRLVPLSFDLSLGNSGGPVFDDDGRVVGIASAILVTTSTKAISAESAAARHDLQTGTGLMLPASEFCDQVASE